MDVHDNDASKFATHHGENVLHSETIIDFGCYPCNFHGKFVALKILVRGKLIQKLRQKGVYEESFSKHATWIGGKLIQLMHTTIVPIQVMTQKIQAGIEVSRRGELRRQLQL
ncbi:hypothetical protein Tco_1278788 [Tanacetum coccineum]